MPDRPRWAWRGRSGSARSRGLTTRGRCLLAGGLAAIICAVVLEERDLLRVGFLAVALPLLAVASTSLGRSRLTATQLVQPTRLHPAMRGRVVLTVTNVGRGRTGVVDIAQQPTAGLAPGLRHLLAPVRAGHSVPISTPLLAQRRGRFTLPAPTVRLTDPLELWEEHRSVPAETEVLVLPVVVPLSGVPASSGARSAASGRSAVGTTGGDPDSGVRPYRPGDDIRTIHWRASARSEDLVVRLHEPVSHGGTTILLDHRAGAHSGTGLASTLETAVVMAASIGLHLVGSDQNVRLVATGDQVIAEGHDIAEDLLTRLALLDPTDEPRLQLRRGPWSGLVLAVLGVIDEADAAAVSAFRHPNEKGIAFLLLPPDPAADTGAATAAPPPGQAALESAGWVVIPVARPSDVVAAWRRACARRGAGFDGDPAGFRSADRWAGAAAS